MCVMPQPFPAAVADQFDDEDELEDDELGHAETYADYMPAKCESELSIACIWAVNHVGYVLIVIGCYFPSIQWW